MDKYSKAIIGGNKLIKMRLGTTMIWESDKEPPAPDAQPDAVEDEKKEPKK